MAVRIILMVFGALLIAIGVIFSFFIRGDMIETETRLKTTQAIKTNEITRVKTGDKILIEGYISQKNPILIYDFVVACKENRRREKSGNKDFYWEVGKIYNQPLIIDVDYNHQVTIEVPDECPSHNHTLVEDSNNKTRYKGYKSGLLITVMGTASVGESVFIGDVTFAAMSREDWIKNIADGKMQTFIIGIVATLLGVLLFFWNIRKFFK